MIDYEAGKMKMPKYIQSQKTESDSFAILLYKFKDIGIFRNQTQHDFGIDFELELIQDDMVTGKFVKIQVKSTEDLRPRKKDGKPTIGGIKQSTLRYWCEMSFSTKVFMVAVNTKDESIYVSKPLFWQCAKLIDDDETTTKTIELLPNCKELKENAIIAEVLLKTFIHAPDLRDQLFRFKQCFRMMLKFFQLYTDIFHYDFHCPIAEIEIYDEFIECCKNILFYVKMEPDKSLGIDATDVENIYSKKHWIQKLIDNGYWGKELCYEAVKSQMQYLFPKFLSELARFRDDMLTSTYYWLRKDPLFHEYIFKYKVPSVRTHEEILDFGYKIDSYNLKSKGEWYLYITPFVEKIKAK